MNASGTPITPENAPPGTRVHVVDMPGSRAKLPIGSEHIVERWYNSETLLVPGDSYCYDMRRFVLAEPKPEPKSSCSTCGTKLEPDDGYLGTMLYCPNANCGMPPAPALVTGYKREGKPDFTLLNYEMLADVVRVLEFGCGKHGRLNYLTNPAVTDAELVAAALRHNLKATLDPFALDDGPGGSGLPHIAAAAANIFMLLHRRANRKQESK